MYLFGGNVFYKLSLEVMILLFFVLLIAPIFFPIYELFRKRDKNLDVDILHTRDPAFLGNSYIKVISCTISKYFNNITSIDDFKKLDSELFFEMDFCFDKGKDKVLITKDFNHSGYRKDSRIDFVVINTMDLELREQFFFKKELIVVGNLIINEKCFFNNLIVLGDVFINFPVDILNFLHVNGEIEVSSRLNVGRSIYCSKRMVVNSTVSSMKIFCPELICKKNFHVEEKYQHVDVDENKIIQISGNIKKNDNFIIDSKGKYVIIHGSVVCEKDITLVGNVWVKDNLFSQGNISISDGVVVGTGGKIKSVVARKFINISGICKFYGYIHSERKVFINP